MYAVEAAGQRYSVAVTITTADQTCITSRAIAYNSDLCTLSKSL